MVQRENLKVFDYLIPIILMPGLFLAPAGILSYKQVALIFAIPHLIYGLVMFSRYYKKETYCKRYKKRDIGFIVSGVGLLIFHFVL
jgi:esterase/lipase superfamily enzyme